MGFSEKFLADLHTKSERFQDRFLSMMDELYSFYGPGDNIQELQDYIQESITFKEKGNIINDRGAFVCGVSSLDDKAKFNEELKNLILEICDEIEFEFPCENGVCPVSHIIIATRAEEGMVTDEDLTVIYFLLRIKYPSSPPELYHISCISDEDDRRIHAVALK